MTESQIRKDILERLPHFFESVQDARVVEEMQISSGKARADIAVIANVLVGIEIKSSQDTLDRLSNQVEHYSRCFDQVVLVVDESHVHAAMPLVPEWWGVIVGSQSTGVARYLVKRRPFTNSRPDSQSIISLLWRSELEELYEHFILSQPAKSASKKKLGACLLERVPEVNLRAAGIEKLRRRDQWRSTPIQKSSPMALG